MKTLQHWLCCLSLLIVGMHSLTAAPVTGPGEKKKFDIHLIWDKGKKVNGACCDSLRGICRIGIVIETIKVPANQKVTASINNNGVLVAEFLKKDLATNKQWLDLFAEGAFYQESTIEVDPEVLKAMKSSLPSYTIKAGNYTIRELPDRYVVEF